MIIRWCMGVKRNGSWFKGGRSGIQDQKNEERAKRAYYVWRTADGSQALEIKLPTVRATPSA